MLATEKSCIPNSGRACKVVKLHGPNRQTRKYFYGKNENLMVRSTHKIRCMGLQPHSPTLSATYDS